MSGKIITSFSRHEVKYLLTPEQYAALLPHLQQHLVMDQYGRIPSAIFFMTQTAMKSLGPPLKSLCTRKNSGLGPTVSRIRRPAAYSLS